jgi:uncharacterized protein (TIGR02271 family)
MQERTTAIALFNDRAEAQRAIGQLKDAGFTEKEIGMTTREADDDQTNARAADGHKETHATEGAVTGLAAGAGVGALWGLGILAGVVPAIGPAIAGGTLAAILSSAAAGAAAAGLAGTLIGYGIPEKEAKYYEKEFQSGRTVVTVHSKERAAEAQAILQRSGGYDMQSSAAGSSRAASTTSRTRQSAQRAATAGEMTLEAREEELEIRKRPVQTGEATIRKETHTERRSIDVPVQKEELVIERHAVDRRAASGPVGENDEIRVPLREEQVEVRKRPVVREHVTVGKRTTQEQQRVEEETRKEEIKVEKGGREGTRPHSR